MGPGGSVGFVNSVVSVGPARGSSAGGDTLPSSPDGPYGPYGPATVYGPKGPATAYGLQEGGGPAGSRPGTSGAGGAGGAGGFEPALRRRFVVTQRPVT